MFHSVRYNHRISECHTIIVIGREHILPLIFFHVKPKTGHIAQITLTWRERRVRIPPIAVFVEQKCISIEIRVSHVKGFQNRSNVIFVLSRDDVIADGASVIGATGATFPKMVLPTDVLGVVLHKRLAESVCQKVFVSRTIGQRGWHKISIYQSIECGDAGGVAIKWQT